MRVSTYVFFPGGGIGRYTDHWARALAQCPDVSVEVVCSPDYLGKDSSAYHVHPGLLQVVHPVPTVRRARFLIAQMVNPLRFIERAVAWRADVVHFANVNHLSFPLWRRRLAHARIPVAITAHDVRRQKTIVSRGWEDGQLRSIYRFADALFVHSEHQAADLMSFASVGRERIHVVPHGPYTHGQPQPGTGTLRARLGVPPERQLALFFGQIRDEKNLDGFIRAMAASGADVHLVVAGHAGARHADGEEYRALARSLGLEGRTTFFLRHIPDAEVAELFGGADWVALPYARTFTSQSGVLNVAVQYRKPVLVSSAPVLRESVEGTDIGVVAAGDDVEALSQAIGAMVRRHREDPRYDFERFLRENSWEENARLTLGVYRQLRDGGR